MNFNLADLANISEVIGAIAIVVSLIYVGVQVADSTRAVRSASANETSSAMSSWYLQIGSDLQSSKVFRRGTAQPETLSEDELFQFIFQMHAMFIQFQGAYYLSQEGTLDIELQESITNAILGVRDQPGFNKYWGQRKDLFKPDFRKYINRLIAEGVTNKNMEQLYQSPKHE
ncbi:MAG: hypothetical protein COA74_10610 [Gammaproteobacteria bacterium]|nr:MAG: hypothetical protein COA74_10610 [Gammaproteobacteria bacterium]